jgi:hypothetical protein
MWMSYMTSGGSRSWAPGDVHDRTMLMNRASALSAVAVTWKEWAKTQMIMCIKDMTCVNEKLDMERLIPPTLL